MYYIHMQGPVYFILEDDCDNQKFNDEKSTSSAQVIHEMENSMHTLILDFTFS